jgi:hypothetical protein
VLQIIPVADHVVDQTIFSGLQTAHKVIPIRQTGRNQPAGRICVEIYFLVRIFGFQKK